MNTATAKAYPNIALVKYWGKKDEQLILPAAGSLSLTLNAFETVTTVSVSPEFTSDSFTLNAQIQTGSSLRRVSAFLDHVRELAQCSDFAHVESTNLAPTGAGLASSASGFAALAVAASHAYGLNLSTIELSRLARRGSGSAARSIIDAVAVWHAGDSDETSYAEAVSAPEMSMTIVTVNDQPKKVSSREAMRRSALTSPFYDAWVHSTEESLRAMLEACRDNDFSRIGRITETHALRMHAVIQSCDPPIRYLSSVSIDIFDAVERLRDSGVEAYATADAGPNVAVISRPEDAKTVENALKPYGKVQVVSAGQGAHLIETAK